MYRLRAAAYSLSVLFAPMAAAQTVLLSDNYTDGSVTSNPAWYSVGIHHSAFVEDDAAGLGAGNAMRIDLTSATSTNLLHAEFPEITLNEVGDYVEVTFDVRIINPSNNTIGSLLRFGFYDTNDTSAADGLNFATDGVGYYVAADVGGRTGAQAFDLRRNRVVSVFNSTFNPDEFGGNASNSDAYALAYDAPHAAYLRIERTVDPFDLTPDLQVTTRIKGPGEDDLVDVTNNVLARIGTIDTFSFGEFNIGTRGSAAAPVTASFIVDNVNVATNLEVSIPTPLAGDFNSDDMVDGVDLDQWIAAFDTGAGADADGDGDSDGEDFLVWQRNLGASTQSQGQSATAIGNVPEPHSLVLVAAAATGTLWRRRRTR